MTLSCPKCKQKNRLPETVQPGKVASCGKCGHRMPSAADIRKIRETLLGNIGGSKGLRDLFGDWI